MFSNWSPRARTFAICLALAAGTLATYWPVRLHDFVSYDDPGYVTENLQVQRGLTWPSVAWAFRTAHAANWHPVTWLAHMVDCQLFGLKPGGHHLMNLAFHVANTLLLFVLLARMTGACWRSAFVAALFALHPLHVESVAWVAERKDVLSTFFGLLTLWAYVRYVDLSEAQNLESTVHGPQTTDHGPRTTHSSRFSFHSSRLYVLSLALFALSLMSKPMLVTLPALMLLLDFWPLRRVSPNTQDTGLKTQDSRLKACSARLLLEKLPFLSLSALASLVTLFVQQPAMGSYRHLPVGARAANAVVSCARYLGKAFWPQDLAVFYPHPVWWPAWVVTGAALLLTTISAFVLWQRRKRPYLPVGWFWFLGLLVPVLGLVQVGVQAMADRYTYLPLVGIFIMLAWTGAECLRAFHVPARLGSVVAVLVLVLCAVLARSQLEVWANTETLFTHAVSVTRGNWVAHYNLALLALRRYQDTQHGPLEKQLVRLPADAPNPPALASRVPPDGSPGSAPPRDYLEEVIIHCQATMQARPEFPDPGVTLAKALTEKGRLDEARAQLEWAIRLNPKSAEAHQNLGEILQRQGRVKEAITEYCAALALKPDWEEVLNNLAWLLATHPSPDVRNGPEAVRLAERTCVLSSHTNLWFLHTLAAAYAEDGAFPQAVEAADQARRLALATAQPGLVATAVSRLELYQSRRPYREP
jgi:tetratricopeptide (TPR) repeat protein